MVLLPRPAHLAALCLISATRATEFCFFPSGEQSNDVPCDPAAPISTCCSTTDACLPSGLCRDTTTNSTSAARFMRATCTDSTWAGSICPPYCIKGNGSSQLNGTASSTPRAKKDMPIRQCSVEGFGARAMFCCGSDDQDTECCTDPATFFRLSDVVTTGEDRQGNELGALNAGPLPPTETPPISLLTSPNKASETSPTIVAALAAPTTLPASASSTSISPPAVTAVLEMANSDGTGAKDTVTFGGNEDTLLVATDVPPLQLANGPAASVTDSAAAVSSSAAVKGPADDSPSDSKLSFDSSTESAEYSRRLSRGAVVAVGVGVSLAGAGLVAMTVFIVARRRVYKKQEKRWREHMRAVQTPKENTASGGGLKPSTERAPGTRTYESSSMRHTRNSSRLEVVGQGKLATRLSILTTLRPEMEGPSPVSEYLREMGWQKGSSLDVPSMDSRSYYSQDSLRAQDADGRGVAAYRSDIESPSARSPGLKPTASWLGRHSIYEMP